MRNSVEEMRNSVEVFLLAKADTAAILTALNGKDGTDQLEFKVSRQAMVVHKHTNFMAREAVGLPSWDLLFCASRLQCHLVGASH